MVFNTYYELLSEEWLVERFRFHASYKFHKLCHLKQYKYSEHPILWVVLNIDTKRKSYIALGAQQNWSGRTT